MKPTTSVFLKRCWLKVPKRKSFNSCSVCNLCFQFPSLQNITILAIWLIIYVSVASDRDSFLWLGYDRGLNAKIWKWWHTSILAKSIVEFSYVKNPNFQSKFSQSSFLRKSILKTPNRTGFCPLNRLKNDGWFYWLKLVTSL